MTLSWCRRCPSLPALIFEAKTTTHAQVHGLCGFFVVSLMGWLGARVKHP